MKHRSTQRLAAGLVAAALLFCTNLTAFAQEETNTEQTAPAGVTVQEDVEEGSGEPQTPDSETVTDGETDANSEVSTNSETDANSEVTTDGETASGANGADRNPDAGEQVFNITPPSHC